MAPELSIRFTAKDETAPISVLLFRPDTGVATPPAPFKPPLDDKTLGELRWYLEEFSGWPSGPDYERAERIENSLENWGRSLRDSVIRGEQAARLWQQFLDAPAEGKLVTIDATDPRVLRLPWELLADNGGHVFARGIGVRRRLQKATVVGETKPFELPVRLLVVVSRPEDAPFIDPRAVSRPLLDALDELGNLVAVEFLYPPTLAALTDRLRDRHAPPVHVVHFDGHGVYDEMQGLGYLLFENETHQSDRVDADRLGTLLFNCGVPLMVLNACQSAKQEKTNPYASVAARLIRSGVGSVLAMNYSVLVMAARKFVAAFYGALADGLTVGQAVDQGRFRLLSDEARHTLTRRTAKGELVEETIRLRDWFLPALYQQSADPVVFGPHPLPTPSPVPPERGRAGVRAGALPPEPLHGFHGRAREMLELERQFAERALVVLHGFGGMGKTALAAEGGRWFQRTGRFPGGAAFVSFEQGGSLQQLCSWVGQAVSGDPNFALGEGEPAGRVADLLRQKPALVILDNFESVLGSQPLMPPEELRAMLDAVWAWATLSPTPPSLPGKVTGGSGSRILITTRDTQFNDQRFAPSTQCAHVELGGLAMSDALDLAAAVLNDHGIDRTQVNRQELVDLMDRLGGHPLSLYLVLPWLRRYSPAELSARFEELLPGFQTGAAKERNESLAVSLEFSLRRLGEATRAALPDLAVFQGGALENVILEITGMDPELWKAARAELEGAALLTAESLPNVAFPFLRFHPTLAPYLAMRLSPARRAALEERYWQRYYAVADFLYKSDTQHPIEARAIALRELPNLRRALDLCLAALSSPLHGESERQEIAGAAVDFAAGIAKFLDVFGRWRERDVMMANVKRQTSSVITGTGGITKAAYLLLSQQGEVLLQQGRAAEAERLFRDLLGRLEAGAAYDGDEAAYDHALTLARLGRCLKAQGWPAQAIAWHRRALAEFERISESANQQISEAAKGMANTARTDLADLHVALGQFDEAKRLYEAALVVDEELGDARGKGVDLCQLGYLALRRSDLAEAARRYTEALATFRALGEPQTEAVAWHQLGMVAQEAKDWQEAERCYREAVRIREQIRDLPMLATDFNQLALVAKGAGRPADAERWYLRAIELNEQLGNLQNLAGNYNNLAALYLSQGRLEEAARYAHRAVEIVEQHQIQTEVWKMYQILAEIAERQGRAAEARGWRQKEIESRDAYAGTKYQVGPILQRFQPVIAAVVAGCKGDAQARAQVEALFDTFRKGNWQIVDAIQRVWAGERDEEALTENIDYNSRAIVHAILAQLAGERPSPPGPLSRGTGEGETPTPTPAPQAEEGQEEAALAAILQQWAPVIAAVVAACRGNQDAAAQLQPFLGKMAQQDDWRALSAVLRRILAGERDPNALLPGLDATDMLIVAAVLQTLGAPPGEASS